MSIVCQGPRCHIYDTTDRKRGPKGNKRNQSRTFALLVVRTIGGMNMEQEPLTTQAEYISLEY